MRLRFNIITKMVIPVIEFNRISALGHMPHILNPRVDSGHLA